MNSKLFARIAAVCFVAIALTMAALELREEPAPAAAEVITVPIETNEAKATLAFCSELGLEAASVDICTEAWAAERRRFLGRAERDAVELETSPEIGSDPAATQAAKGR